MIIKKKISLRWYQDYYFYFFAGFVLYDIPLTVIYDDDRILKKILIGNVILNSPLTTDS